MKWAGIYLAGYAIFVGGFFAALWQWGILARMGATWIVIAVVIAIGIGIMLAISKSGHR
jgi:hypothetical protein